MKTKNFTLVELMVSMAVLSIFMLGMIQLFTSTQKMISVTTAKNELFASSRIIMDMISNDVECLYVDKNAEECTFMA